MKRLALLCIAILAATTLLSPTGWAAGKYKEAPMLEKMVLQGTLPPVEQRLPIRPVVVEPVEEIGQYGGTWERAWLGPSDSPGPSRLTFVGLIEWTRDGRNLQPALAESWEFDPTGKTLMLHLREGVKWSDGQPFTADDIMFWYEDIILNDELTPAKPSWLKVKGELTVFRKVDQYTVKCEFPTPFAIFEKHLAWQMPFAPKHYLKKYHAKYRELRELSSEAKAAGFENWYSYFAHKNNWIENPDLPTLRAWKPINSAKEARWIMERNPYYWKVDTAGNQLPYIDRIVHTLVDKPELINLKAIAGEIDMQARHMNLQNYPIFLENAKRNDYRVFLWKTAMGADAYFAPNLTHKDPVLREIINDRRFRIALSVAINREEINDLIYLGLGEPRAATVTPESPGYKEEFARLYAEYDPTKANSLLDEMGLDRRDSSGYRLRPDGKPLQLTIDVVNVFGPWVSVAELVSQYWQDIGIKANVRTMERSLFFTRVAAADYDVAVWSLGGILHFDLRPGRFVPQTPDLTLFAPAVATWVQSNGKSGEPPWGDLQKVIDLYEQLIVTLDPQERIHLMHEILRINAENVWNIGTVGRVPSTMALVIVKNNFRNVPENGLEDVVLSNPKHTLPEQYFIKQ